MASDVEIMLYFRDFQRSVQKVSIVVPFICQTIELYTISLQMYKETTLSQGTVDIQTCNSTDEVNNNSNVENSEVNGMPE